MSRAGLIIVLLIAFIILPSVRLGQHLGIVQEAQAATTSITLYNSCIENYIPDNRNPLHSSGGNNRTRLFGRG